MSIKKFRLPITIFLALLAITLLFIFIPHQWVFENTPLVKDLYNNTTLIVTTQRGKAKIRIDGKDFGETNQTIENLPSGTYEIDL